MLLTHKIAILSHGDRVLFQRTE